MSILSRLHRRFRVDAKLPPASRADIEALRNYAGRSIPLEYEALAMDATEIEILVDGKGYIRIWGPRGCIEMNDAYAFSTHIPGSLGIGDDEGGSALIYMDGKKGDGLYLVSFADPDVASAVFVAPSLEAFLVAGEGATIGT